MTEYFAFNKSRLIALSPAQKKYEVADNNVDGLRLSIYPTGNKVFKLLRRLGSQTRRVNIGAFSRLSIEQARNEAKRLNSLITLGENPYKTKRDARYEPTFKELWLQYYHEHALKYTKRPEDNKKMIEHHVLKGLGSLKHSEISNDTIFKLHEHMGKYSGHGGANRVIRIISAVFNYSVKKRRIASNPCTGIKMYPEYSRDRFLSKDELKKFFSALYLEEEIYQDFFILLLLTGARKTNMLTMKYKSIDFENKFWRIAPKEAKNGETNIIYLSDYCLEIILRRKAKDCLNPEDAPFVFVGTGKNGHLADPKKSFKRIKKSMGVEDFRLHDLRRTFGSYMAISGASLPVIGKALNHKSLDSTQIYARLSQSAVSSAINSATELMLKN